MGKPFQIHLVVIIFMNNSKELCFIKLAYTLSSRKTKQNNLIIICIKKTPNRLICKYKLLPFSKFGTVFTIKCTFEFFLPIWYHQRNPHGNT